MVRTSLSQFKSNYVVSRAVPCCCHFIHVILYHGRAIVTLAFLPKLKLVSPCYKQLGQGRGRVAPYRADAHFTDKKSLSNSYQYPPQYCRNRRCFFFVRVNIERRAPIEQTNKQKKQAKYIDCSLRVQGGSTTVAVFTLAQCARLWGDLNWGRRIADSCAAKWEKVLPKMGSGSNGRL